MLSKSQGLDLRANTTGKRSSDMNTILMWPHRSFISVWILFTPINGFKKRASNLNYIKPQEKDSDISRFIGFRITTFIFLAERLCP